jgi:DNA-binding NtrC family response regulator
VQSIVRQQGGEVHVESTLGQGSAFEVRLPRSSQPHDAAAAPVGRARHRGTEHVLMVEDDASVRQLAVRALVGAGHQVSAAADGEAALRLLADPMLPFALVVTDVVLPSADGLELAQRARELRPGVRVLLTSGYPAERLPAEGIDFLPKPFTPSMLLERVRASLDAVPAR